MDAFDPLQANGHNLLNDEWQRTMERHVQQVSLRALRINQDQQNQNAEMEDQQSNAIHGTVAGRAVGGGGGRAGGVQDLFGLAQAPTNTGASSKESNQMTLTASGACAVDRRCMVMLMPEMNEHGECAPWMSGAGSGATRKITVPSDNLVGLDAAGRAWIEELQHELCVKRRMSEARVTLHSLPQRALPLYYYAIQVQVNPDQWSSSARNFIPSAFVCQMEHWCAPLTRARLFYLVQHSMIRNDLFDLRTAHNLVHQLWGDAQEEGTVSWSVHQDHCLERTFEHLETRWRQLCSSSTNCVATGAGVDQLQPTSAAMTPETQIAQAHAAARPENLGKRARDWLVQFLKHPEVVRYFGGDSMRRLARYWPMQWLMGLSISHDAGMTDAKGHKRENQLQRLEHMIREDPSRFCTENSRPQNINSREYPSSASSYGCSRSGLAPVLNLEQVMRACVDYEILGEEVERANCTMMDLIVNQIMRHTFYRKFHMCCNAFKLCNKVHKYLTVLLEHYRGLARPSPALWNPPSVRATSEHNRSEENDDSVSNAQLPHAVQIDMKWFQTKTKLRVIQSAGRLCSAQYQGALVPCMRGVSHYELLDRMQGGLFSPVELNDLWFYVRESHDTEGMMLYGAYLICNQASFIAQRDGPLMLRRIPPTMSCCSEQLAFLRYALGYDSNGQHTVGCEAFANAQGRGGAGKTQLLELLSCALGDTRQLLVLAYQGSHIANVERRFPHLRTATIRMFMHKHCMLCTRTMQHARSTMSTERYKMFASMIADLKKRMVNNAKAWQTDHQEENKRYSEMARADGTPIPIDEQQRRQYGPEAFTYGMPYEQCPLERVVVVVLEEFGMAPMGDIALLLNVLAKCCPRLRCVVTMGDKHQLYPISPGHIQQSFLEGFGWVQFDHSHRQGEGCLSQLARAMQTMNPDLLQFDNKTALLVEPEPTDMLRTLRDVCRHYQLTPYMSQIIARTNEMRMAINAAMKPHMYPHALSVQGALNAPAAPWNQRLSQDKQRLAQLQRAAREYDALEKINYKLNVPSLGLCNNGMYIVWSVLVLKIERRPQDNDGQCDAYGMPLNNSARRQSMKEWQQEACRAAAQNEQESLVAAQLLSLSRDSSNSNSFARDFYGTLMGVDSELALAPPLCLTDDPVIRIGSLLSSSSASAGNSNSVSKPVVANSSNTEEDLSIDDLLQDFSAELDDNLSFGDINNIAARPDTNAPMNLLPSGLFNSETPSLANGPGTRAPREVELRLPRTTLLAILKASQENVPDDVCSSMYKVTVDRVMSTTMDPPNISSADAQAMHARTILLCTPFRDDMNIKAPVDQRELIYMPYTPDRRKLVQPALCVTGHCMQGNQSTCVIFVVPYCSKYDTCNYGYTAFTRALYNAQRQSQLARDKRPQHPSLIVLGSMRSLQRMAQKAEPERVSHTGRLLRMVRDITCKTLPRMDYCECALLEHQEAGKFGRRDEPFLQLFATQLNTDEEQALRTAKERAESSSVESLMADDDDDMDMYNALLQVSSKRAALMNSNGNSNSRTFDEDWLNDIPSGVPLRIIHESTNSNSGHTWGERSDVDAQQEHQSKRRAPPSSSLYASKGDSYRVDAQAIGEMYQPDKPCAFDIDFSMRIGGK